LFLQPKAKWRSFDEAWFMNSPIGHNQFHLIMDKLTANFLDLHKRILSNKTSWGVKITRMEEALVPWEYGMEVTSHKDLILYGK